MTWKDAVTNFATEKCIIYKLLSGRGDNQALLLCFCVSHLAPVQVCAALLSIFSRPSTGSYLMPGLCGYSCSTTEWEAVVAEKACWEMRLALSGAMCVLCVRALGTETAIITLLLCKPGLWSSNHILPSGSAPVSCRRLQVRIHNQPLADRNQIEPLHVEIHLVSSAPCIHICFLWLSCFLPWESES